MLESFAVPHERRVVSAHRTPDAMDDYDRSAESRGLQAIIAGAGGAAHLPGMVASHTLVPVLGVPVESRVLRGVDSPAPRVAEDTTAPLLDHIVAPDELVELVRELERMGFMALLKKILRPVFSPMGIGDEASTITVIGLILGLSYGGGMIISEARKGTSQW